MDNTYAQISFLVNYTYLTSITINLRYKSKYFVNWSINKFDLWNSSTTDMHVSLTNLQEPWKMLLEHLKKNYINYINIDLWFKTFKLVDFELRFVVRYYYTNFLIHVVLHIAVPLCRCSPVAVMSLLCRYNVMSARSLLVFYIS